MPKTSFIPLGRLAELKSAPGAELILLKPGAGAMSDYKVIRFSTRHALESFNMPLVRTMAAKLHLPAASHDRSAEE